MLIACAADAHRRRPQREALMKRLPALYAFCFLGDCDEDSAWLEAALGAAQPGAAFYTVAGNNDPGSALPRTVEWTAGDRKILMTHGHLFRVKLTHAMLAEYAKERRCDLALFGHTHIPADETEQGIRLVNPGALALGHWALIDLGERISVRLQVL